MLKVYAEFYDLYKTKKVTKTLFSICTVCEIKSDCIYKTKIATKTYSKHLYSIYDSIYKGMFLHKIKVCAEYYDLYQTKVVTKAYYKHLYSFYWKIFCIYETKIAIKIYFKYLYSICDSVYKGMFLHKL